VNDIAENAKARIQNITQQYTDGKINAAEWTIRMGNEIKNGHKAMAALARGGREQMRAQDWGRVGNQIAKQNGYLMRFSGDVIYNKVSAAQMVNRAGMYADAMYGTYHNTVQVREAQAGVAIARRVLDGSAEHCEDCPGLADQGWVPIAELTPIGDSECGANCRCTIEYGTEAQAA